MSFTRIDKAAGSAPDALDEALAIARQRLEDQYPSPNARIGPAASLIRDFSEVARVGGSLEARAAAVFVRTLTSRICDEELENIRARAGERTAQIVALTHDYRWDGRRLPLRVWRRVKRIHRCDDADARLVLEQVALRDAETLARNHEHLEAEVVAELASALRVVAESSELDPSVAASVAEWLAASGLVGARPWGQMPPHDPVDPRILALGHCRSDNYRPYLTWHEDLGALGETLVAEADAVLVGAELVERRRQLGLALEAWHAGRMSDVDAQSELARLSPLQSEWIGTFDQLRVSDDEFAREIRQWYWDEDPKDDPIPDRLLDDFIEVIGHYGEM